MAVSTLVRVIVLNLCGFPVGGYILFVLIVAIAPCVLVATVATPETHDPDTVFTTVASHPLIVVG
jgi:hypothetical protein